MSMSSSSQIGSNLASSMAFYPIVGNCEKLSALQKIFKTVLEPLYGSQEDALNKIKVGKDRACFLLYEQETPVGVIAFKTLFSDEFVSLGLKKSIEIKSLFVVNSENNSGRGLGSILLNKVIEESNKLKIGHESFHVTVSETKGESLNFFKRKGFRIIHEWSGKYMPNVKEYLLSCSTNAVNALPVLSPVKPSASASSASSSISQPLDKKFGAYLRVRNAHWLDIHVLKRLSDGTFISGSKDNSLLKWNRQGEVVWVVNEVEPTLTDEKDWVTAAAVINDEYWISGERNGRISLWTTAGDYVKTLHSKLPKNEHVSHAFNKKRVNCLSAGLNPQKPSFFGGFPTLFNEFNLIEGKTTASIHVHNNDWVYCIRPLSDNRILTATAGVLETWQRSPYDWQREKVLMRETKKVQGQRPFISNLLPLRSSAQHFGLTLFGGEVRVYDLQQEKVIQTWQEHKNRIWSIENISPQVFATGGEDRSIKLWDIRQSQSVRTIEKHIGDVTALLSLEDDYLIAGTCPSNNSASNEGAELVFYDLRG